MITHFKWLQGSARIKVPYENKNNSNNTRVLSTFFRECHEFFLKDFFSAPRFLPMLQKLLDK